MYKIFTITLVFLLFKTDIVAQKHDYTWLFGYGYALNFGDTFGISILDFNTKSLNPTIYFKKDYNKEIDFIRSCVSMSDVHGRFIFACNSKEIMNFKGDTMQNGEDIDPDPNNWAQLFWQTCTTIPLGLAGESYLLLHESETVTNIAVVAYALYLSKIQFDTVNNRYYIKEKAQTYFTDTIQKAGNTMVKHANGLDWWLIKPGYEDKSIYVFLVNNFGIKLNHIVSLDSSLYHSSVNAYQSSDGKYYDRVSSSEDNTPTYIDLFYFDRCLGSLRNIKKFNIPFTGIKTGVCFSPNSRFLYVSTTSIPTKLICTQLN